jgi:hypothetical protein
MSQGRWKWRADRAIASLYSMGENYVACVASMTYSHMPSPEIDLNTKRLGRLFSTPISYSGGPGLEARRGDRKF